MSILVELTVLVITLFGLSLGSCCIYWIKVRPTDRQAWWGSRLFVATLLLLGITALVAALLRAEGLAPLGLLSVLLIVGMLWETPIPAQAPGEPAQARET